MKNKIFILIIIFTATNNLLAQYYNEYKLFNELSKPKHPMLIQLNGDIAIITQVIHSYKHLYDFCGEHKFYFSNGKLIKDSSFLDVKSYFYDNEGILSKIIRVHTFEDGSEFVKITDFIIDSSQHQLVKIKFDNVHKSKHTIYETNVTQANSVVSIDNNHAMYELDSLNRIVKSSDIGRLEGWTSYFYDENGDLDKEIITHVSSACNYVFIFDKYQNYVKNSCNMGCGESSINYEYSNFDSKGNWTFGQSTVDRLRPLGRVSDEVLKTTRDYQYH